MINKGAFNLRLADHNVHNALVTGLNKLIVVSIFIRQNSFHSDFQKLVLLFEQCGGP